MLVPRPMHLDLHACGPLPDTTHACLHESPWCKELVILQAAANWSEIINDPEIDAVVIGTWPYTHHTLVLAALAANKHVLTEARLVGHIHTHRYCCCQCCGTSAQERVLVQIAQVFQSCMLMLTLTLCSALHWFNLTLTPPFRGDDYLSNANVKLHVQASLACSETQATAAYMLNIHPNMLHTKVWIFITLMY